MSGPGESFLLTALKRRTALIFHSRGTQSVQCGNRAGYYNNNKSAYHAKNSHTKTEQIKTDV